MNKTLFTYFSATGTTRRVAEKLAQEKQADILEIKPVIPYTNEDINWQDHDSRANREGRDQVEGLWNHLIFVIMTIFMLVSPFGGIPLPGLSSVSLKPMIFQIKQSTYLRHLAVHLFKERSRI